MYLSQGPAIPLLYMNAYSSSVHNHQKEEQLKCPSIQMFVWLDKQVLVHPHNGILLSNKKECTIYICNNLDESQRHYAEWKSQFQNISVCFPVYDILEKTNQ